MKNKNKNKIKKVYLGESLLNERYRLGDKLGRGGLCKVYKSNDIYCEYFKDEKTFAIKVPLKKLLEKEDAAAFMYSEYKLLRSINHKNIIKVYDYGIDNNTSLPYLVLEYLEGSLLLDIPIYDMKKVLIRDLFAKVLETIKYLHSLNIIHADINPNNIMVLPSNEIKLFDFGISQHKELIEDTSLCFEKVNAYNPKYCAPEVLLGKKPSFESDIFSLACVFYEIFTSILPFKNTSQDLEKNAITFFSCSKKIPLALKFWFIRALSYDAKKRIQK
ncbi:MAG: serine/threonine protein kinase [Campylobacteraceae bacterium]|nr:serine/threonine protein kinase [Campylobacteraceae bacterium]